MLCAVLRDCVRCVVQREAFKLVLLALDVVTIVVPPALPAALTAGLIYSQERLSYAGVICLSPPRINLAGRVNLVALDKTGTMTKSDLRLCGLMHCRRVGVGSPKLAFEKPPIAALALDDPPDGGSCREQLLLALASCHSIARVVQYADQFELVGDPMELQTFAASNMVRTCRCPIW